MATPAKAEVDAATRDALDAGAKPQDLIGVLRAVAPQVGGPRVMAAAPELMLALGLELPDDV
jgi:alkylhydroperoxidase/carboxymuconolactone decarboxylase family protein YurZ